MRSLKAAVLLLLACAACFGQTSYMGITPGVSTRAEAEQVLGTPLQAVSKTLVEYKSPEGAGKLYVQYRDGSTAATCRQLNTDLNSHKG